MTREYDRKYAHLLFDMLREDEKQSLVEWMEEALPDADLPSIYQVAVDLVNLRKTINKRLEK